MQQTIILSVFMMVLEYYASQIDSISASKLSMLV